MVKRFFATLGAVILLLPGLTAQAADDPNRSNETPQVIYYNPEWTAEVGNDDGMIAAIDIATGVSSTQELDTELDGYYAISVHIELPDGVVWHGARISAYLPPVWDEGGYSDIGVTISDDSGHARYASIRVNGPAGTHPSMEDAPVVFSHGRTMQLDPVDFLSANGTPIGYEMLDGEIYGGSNGTLEVVFYFTIDQATTIDEQLLQPQDGPSRKALCEADEPMVISVDFDPHGEASNWSAEANLPEPTLSGTIIGGLLLMAFFVIAFVVMLKMSPQHRR